MKMNLLGRQGRNDPLWPWENVIHASPGDRALTGARGARTGWSDRQLAGEEHKAWPCTTGYLLPSEELFIPESNRIRELCNISMEMTGGQGIWWNTVSISEIWEGHKVWEQQCTMVDQLSGPGNTGWLVKVKGHCQFLLPLTDGPHQDTMDHVFSLFKFYHYSSFSSNVFTSKKPLWLHVTLDPSSSQSERYVTPGFYFFLHGTYHNVKPQCVYCFCWLMFSLLWKVIYYILEPILFLHHCTLLHR